MNREVHVRYCGGLEVRFLRSTRLISHYQAPDFLTYSKGIAKSQLLEYLQSIAGMLENLVFLELKRRGYQVYIGKIENKEVDFIAEKENRKIYLQVTYLLASLDTIEREFSALKMIKDNYPKYVISMDKIFGTDFEGIKRNNLVDFLLTDNI